MDSMDLPKKVAIEGIALCPFMDERVEVGLHVC